MYTTKEQGTLNGGKTMKKATWIVKAYTGYKTGWQEIRRFDNPGDADAWLCSLIREKGYIPTDFTIVKR